LANSVLFSTAVWRGSLDAIKSFKAAVLDVLMIKKLY